MTRATLEVDGRPHEVAVARKGDAWTVTVDGQAFEARRERNGAGLVVRIGERSLHVHLGPGQAQVDGRPLTWRVVDVSALGDGPGAGSAVGAKVRPPMNGKLERLLVQAGQEVAAGDVLFILEAMKMQNEVRSPMAGRVTAVHAQAGAALEPSKVVLELEPL
jgi:biotin carboxyl carrier protein